MATTGQVDTKTTYDSFFWVYWSQVSQDVAKNKTTIYWSCGVTCGHDFKLNAIQMSEVYINGSLVYGGGTYSNLSKGEHRLAYGYLDIPHDPNGTKTFNISSFWGWLYPNHNYSAAASSHTLTQIPRKAILENATDFTDRTNPTVTYSNPAGESATSLQAFIYATDDKILVDAKDLGKNGTSETLSPTTTEIDNLREAAKNGSTKVHFWIRTRFGAEDYWSGPIEKTFNVEESDETRPQVTLGVSVNNDSLPREYADTFKGMYIQGKSKVNTTVSAEGKYDATISKRYATIEGKTYDSDSFTSDNIKGSGTVTITGYAKDSRGFTGSKTEYINVIPYSKPVVEPIDGKKDVLCYRGSDGIKDNTCESVYVAAKMVYWSVGGKNSCKMEWRRKLATESWDDDKHTWQILIGYNESATAFANILQVQENEGFKLDKAYTIQIRVMDYLGEEGRSTFDIPTTDVALHLGRDGKNVSVGSYCDYTEDYTFHSEWKTILDRELVVKGVASFDSGAKINGQQIMNFVVEEGTNGIWTYRKWADGKAECWGIYTQNNVAVNAAWGSLYESAGIWLKLPNGLFVETPQFNITMVGTQAVMLDVYMAGSTEVTPRMTAVRPDVKTIDTLNISIVCHGRWKK